MNEITTIVLEAQTAAQGYHIQRNLGADNREGLYTYGEEPSSEEEKYIGGCLADHLGPSWTSGGKL